MSKFLIILNFAFLLLNSAFGQGGTWTWISGDSTNSTGVYGTQGIPSVNNHPPGLYEAGEWKDKQGNFWIYGGEPWGDLWKFNPVTLEWTWEKGNGQIYTPPVYGIQGVPNVLNTPGFRSIAVATWVDSTGNLWLFGGDGAKGHQNDLWKYNISTGNWTWMKGDTLANAAGVHGTSGIPSASNTPGGRAETCSSWTDSLNDLWLFGGWGIDDNGTQGYLNDLCKYDISTNEWTWMKGSAYANASASYGVKGVSNAGNDPGARWTYTKWKDLQGNFWIMGGNAAVGNYLNDMWKYEVSVNEWTWMNGNNLPNDQGIYNSSCIFFKSNLPSSRFEQRSSVTDCAGNFWMLGGNASGQLNDLWVFDPQKLQWNWLGGSRLPGQKGNYGTLGVSSPTNMPGGRQGALAWWGNDNKFYLFGGYQGNNIEIPDVWVFTPDTNCIPVSCNAAILAPVADFQSGKTAICTNDCISFTDLSTGNPTNWLWSFQGGNPSLSTLQKPQNVCYSAAGTFNVTLIVSNGAGTDSVTMTNLIRVLQSPPTPTITQSHDTLFCSLNPSYTAYQWYADSVLIPGATNPYYVAGHSGDYSVVVYNESGCKSSAGINIIIGIQNYTNDNIFSLSPNPASDQLTLHASSSIGWHTATVSILNVIGQVCHEEEVVNHKSEIVINISSLSSGIYFLQMKTQSITDTKRFVKE